MEWNLANRAELGDISLPNLSLLVLSNEIINSPFPIKKKEIMFKNDWKGNLNLSYLIALFRSLSLFFQSDFAISPHLLISFH